MALRFAIWSRPWEASCICSVIDYHQLKLWSPRANGFLEWPSLKSQTRSVIWCFTMDYESGNVKRWENVVSEYQRELNCLAFGWHRRRGPRFRRLPGGA